MKQIYFAQTDTGVMKIGCCNNVFNRMETLRNQTKFKMSLCKYRNFPDRVAELVEKALIERFKPYLIWKTKREWFVPSEEIMTYMALDFPNVDHVCTGEEDLACCRHKRGCTYKPQVCVGEGHYIINMQAT